jgi:hypothetical protein
VAYGTREGDLRGWPMVLIPVLGSIRGNTVGEGDPKGWPTVLIPKKETLKNKRWSMVLITVLGSQEKPVPRSHSMPHSSG